MEGCASAGVGTGSVEVSRASTERYCPIAQKRVLLYRFFGLSGRGSHGQGHERWVTRCMSGCGAHRRAAVWQPRRRRHEHGSGGAQTTATDKRLREGNEIPSAAPLAIHKQSETTKHADRPRIDLELNGKRHRASSRGEHARHARACERHEWHAATAGGAVAEVGTSQYDTPPLRVDRLGPINTSRTARRPRKS